MAKICLISCVSKKEAQKLPAADLYTSPLFAKTKAFALSGFDAWYILSAKYGLLRPDQVIEPYEATLNKLSKNERIAWANSVYLELERFLNPQDEITILAGSRYREHLVPLLERKGLNVSVPLEGMSIGNQLQWLNKKTKFDARAKHLDRFYSYLEILKRGCGGMRVLQECNGKLPWPKRGVYFFFEPNEVRTNHPNTLRVVRVGTHGVSRGSSSTLWTRLKTHLGANNGGGNHRGSIFRLHAGMAIMNQCQRKIDISSWGKGQVAAAEIRLSETELEKRVSSYLGSMSLLWLAIDDEPSPFSDRAYIERNSIGLLSGPKGPLDHPGRNWLGRYSAQDAIRWSGLWNVDFVTYQYDPRFLDVLERYVEITLGKRRPPKKSIAPRNWYLSDSRNSRSNQLFLFPEE